MTLKKIFVFVICCLHFGCRYSQKTALSGGDINESASEYEVQNFDKRFTGPCKEIHKDVIKGNVIKEIDYSYNDSGFLAKEMWQFNIYNASRFVEYEYLKTGGLKFKSETTIFYPGWLEPHDSSMVNSSHTTYSKRSNIIKIFRFSLVGEETPRVHELFYKYDSHDNLVEIRQKILSKNGEWEERSVENWIHEYNSKGQLVSTFHEINVACPKRETKIVRMYNLEGEIEKEIYYYNYTDEPTYVSYNYNETGKVVVQSSRNKIEWEKKINSEGLLISHKEFDLNGDIEYDENRVYDSVGNLLEKVIIKTPAFNQKVEHKHIYYYDCWLSQ